MAQSWRLNELIASCSKDDLVFSRRVPNRGSSFFAWPGLKPEEVAQGMLQMPENLRTAHTVFGRADVPLDLALDIDEKLPIGKEFRDTNKVRAYQRKCLEESLIAIHKVLGERGEKIESQVVLISPNLHKLSFHVHIKLHNKAFKDYTHLGAFVKSIIAPKVPKVDTQIYRQNGSLRLFQSKKEDNTCAMAYYDDEFQINIPRIGGEGEDKQQPTKSSENTEGTSAAAKKKVTAATKKKVHYRSAAAAAAAAELEAKKAKEAELAKRAAAGPSSSSSSSSIVTGLSCPLSPEAAMLHSFIVRPTGTFNEFVHVSAEELETSRRTNFGGVTADGKTVPLPGLGPNARPLMPLTAAEAIINAKSWIEMLPEDLAVHYNDWIRIGLYAFRIAGEFEAKFAELYGGGKKPLPEGLTYESPSQELLSAWISFSKRCPLKYRIGDCELRWSQMRRSETVPFFSAYSNLAALTRWGQ